LETVLEESLPKKSSNTPHPDFVVGLGEAGTSEYSGVVSVGSAATVLG
jgi:hypothetical protein